MEQRLMRSALVKRGIAIGAALLLVGLAGVASATTAGENARGPFALNCKPAAYNGEPATLDFFWWRGGSDSVSDKWIADAVNCFKKKYAGKITLNIEYVPGAHDYIAKIKPEIAAGELPVLVTLKLDPTVSQLLLKQNKIVNLKPYFNADPRWRAISLKDSVAFNTVKGKLVASPDTYRTAIGAFFNKALFAKAGVKTLPTDWPGFFRTLEALKAAGIPALSLHTLETGWSAMLIYEALIARTQEGRRFLEISFPKNFNRPFLLKATKDLQKIFQYTTEDAIGGAYANAANNFLSGKTAIMPNGPWMIGDFRDPKKTSPGLGKVVDVQLYPGNVAVDDTGRQLGDYAVVKGYPKNVTDAAVEFIKWMNSAEVTRQRVIRLGSIAPNLKLPARDLKALDPLASKLIRLVQEKRAPILPNYQGQWNTIVQNEAIVQSLPQLALGRISPQEFLTRLSKAAKAG